MDRDEQARRIMAEQRVGWLEDQLAALEAAGDALADDADWWMPVYHNVNPPAHRQTLALVAAWRAMRGVSQ